ncbi:MAG: vWA domain-containing protein, partial [Myxococcota bacterium]|nr:vWA domain-containing protein [Myxococcota bacterium]
MSYRHPSCIALLSMLGATLVAMEGVLPLPQAEDGVRRDMDTETARQIRSRVQGSWRLTGYLLWNDGSYMDVPASGRYASPETPRSNEIIEAWDFRPDGTYRHVMDANLWFTGRYTIEEGWYGQGASVASPPRTLVLALDVSGTMTGAPIQAARDAALEVLSRVGPADQVSLVTFGDSVQATPLSESRAGLQKRIRDLQANQRTTHLNDGIARSLDIADKAKGIRTVVVLSDGKDEGSSVDLPTLLDRSEQL